LSLKTIGTVFSNLASKPVLTVFSGLASKPLVTISPGLASKPVAAGFPVWASKLVATVWLFGPQNHRDSLLVCASKPSGRWSVGWASKPMGGCDGVRHKSRSSGLLHVEVNRGRVSQSGLKIGRGVKAGGSHGTIAEVALSGS
jgi:hypothetical protein